MKKLILAVAVAVTVFSCKKDGETGATTSNEEITQEGKDASYAFGITVGQRTEQMNGAGGQDSLDFDEVKKGILDFLKDPKKQQSYAYGFTVGQQIQGALDNKVMSGQLDKDEIITGMMDYLNKKDLRVSEDSISVIMDNFYQNQLTRTTEKNKKEGVDYMNNIKKEDGVQVTDSGLAYKVIEEGSGEKPMAGDRVKVKYEGTLIDGEVFDGTDKNNNGEPVEFPLNPGGLIPGWIEGMQLMSKGAKYKFYIPAELGYGDRQSGGIAPGSTLIFDIELVDFTKGEAPQTPQLPPGQPGVNIVPQSQD